MSIKYEYKVFFFLFDICIYLNMVFKIFIFYYIYNVVWYGNGNWSSGIFCWMGGWGGSIGYGFDNICLICYFF